ncbi:hypothetical protein QDY71_10205 [Kingella negevensis]|uniref:Uncharacterized protein n=1 Tax=Kingella negevensis TaxID=1522312 RepID=A0A238TGA9_9NEIS|nr:hypothetical protein [Kingella negevensis]MDK4680841.1 hypothetical protein [Kingella negevensis]MDK4681436.1 hypothetical protein [Kingella negevensis]MDK4684281.1 hypothetical protein [Kingella negevensis]MDK4691822.1 hypothetical protein [Kingella negevensis]MDK4693024.1 hypothetical protein [Kingella negevensis]
MIYLNFDKTQHGAPYGNTSVFCFDLKTNAKGAPLNSSSVDALKVNDELVLGELPECMRLDDAQVLVKTAMTSGVTADLGFVYADGEEDTTVPQDKAFFGSGLVLNATARLRTATAKIVKLPKPAYLVLTLKGATNAKAADVSVLVQGELLGAL